MRPAQRGVTLLELLIAVTLLSLLSVAMFTAMRLGLSAFTRADSKLMLNRRVAGAQRILQSQLEGLVPATALCGAGPAGGGARYTFFQGDPAAMRLVSTFSLQGGWRGQPQILEIFVIPAEQRGVRLVVNEIPYTGSRGAGRLCTPGSNVPQFLPVAAAPTSFVLADELVFCRFLYLGHAQDPNQPDLWSAAWRNNLLPLAVRIEMAPLDADPSRVQPTSITAPIYVRRDPEIPYEDKEY
jgi:prepilin-type N-terminal cleavage/methylation domain-containing protein